MTMALDELLERRNGQLTALMSSMSDDVLDQAIRFGAMEAEQDSHNGGSLGTGRAFIMQLGIHALLLHRAERDRAKEVK